MLKDECVVVNYMDEVVGHDNKYNCHKFLPGQPKGIVHRAFSVMLFDAEGRILLQQRAASKITFPNVWTNTCCSHPLHGMQPPEVDTPEAVAGGDPEGVKHAAVRKLGHELGIRNSELQVDRFRFMTRVHYWAADTVTHGRDAPWGEHEIDYLLLYRLKPGELITLTPNEEEVQSVRWLSLEDLRIAMAGGDGELPKSMPLWSPWFRVIAERFLYTWWQDLDAAITTNKYVDVSGIHRFDAPVEHLGGAGDAIPSLDELYVAEQQTMAGRRELALEAGKGEQIFGFINRHVPNSKSTGMERGANGKVPMHKYSIFDTLARPLELLAMLRLNAGILEDNLRKERANPDVAFCDVMLGRVSPSYAVAIRQLPEGLCIDVCIFYLVLRALDIIWDDMEAFQSRGAEKETELISFGARRLSDELCSINGVGQGNDARLLRKFGKVARVFNTLPADSQAVIRDITDKIGAGMAEFVSADLGQGTRNLAEYNRYCHKVSGLVGEGLTRIFVARGESDALKGQGKHIWPFCADSQKQPANFALANSLGIFLQKTNIIRDYLEDYIDGRAFWPHSVWQTHSFTGDLGEFARPTAHGAGKVLPMSGKAQTVAAKGVGLQALRCLNELIADALELVPDSLEYLDLLRTPGIFRFCAMSQLLAMATLTECFDNPKVFTGVVKIRKGLTARLICACVGGPDAILFWFERFARQLMSVAKSGKCAGANSYIGERVVTVCSRIIDTAQRKSQEAPLAVVRQCGL